MKQIRDHEARLAQFLQNSLAPSHAGTEFGHSLRERLARLTSMPVLIEQPRHMARSVGLGILGLIGVIASAFAAALVALRFLGWVLTSLGLVPKVRPQPQVPERKVHD